MKSEEHIPHVHPGKVLQDELDEIGVTQTALAGHIGVLPKTVNEICRGKRGISAEMAILLSQALGASPTFWMNLQSNWELSEASGNRYKQLELIAA
ncbi:MAG: HigA family addiction module antitoxin [Pyrinomonadaceae bacterium]